MTSRLAFFDRQHSSRGKTKLIEIVQGYDISSFEKLATDERSGFWPQTSSDKN